MLPPSPARVPAHCMIWTTLASTTSFYPATETPPENYLDHHCKGQDEHVTRFQFPESTTCPYLRLTASSSSCSCVKLYSDISGVRCHWRLWACYGEKCLCGKIKWSNSVRLLLSNDNFGNIAGMIGQALQSSQCQPLKRQARQSGKIAIVNCPFVQVVMPLASRVRIVACSLPYNQSNARGYSNAIHALSVQSSILAPKPQSK